VPSQAGERYSLLVRAWKHKVRRRASWEKRDDLLVQRKSLPAHETSLPLETVADTLKTNSFPPAVDGSRPTHFISTSAVDLVGAMVLTRHFAASRWAPDL
jgi:hypothetical protein